jgi:hypothetical protein
MTQAANLGALGTNAGTTGILAATGGGTAGTAGETGTSGTSTSLIGTSGNNIVLPLTPATTTTTSSTTTTTTTAFPGLFSGTVDVHQGPFCVTFPLTTLLVTGDGTTFCNSTQFTASGFTSLPSQTFGLRLGADTLVVTTNGSNVALVIAACYECPTTTTTTTTVFPGYYTWYLAGSNTFSDPCAIFTNIAPVYTYQSALSDSIVIYTNTGLSVPYNGYAYVSNSLTKWTMAAGVLTSGVSC